MGDNGNNIELLCVICSKPARSNAHVHVCDNCGKGYHTACAKLAAVSLNGKPGKACPPCIIQASSTKNKSSGRPRTGSSTSTSSLSEIKDTVGDDSLQTNESSTEDLLKSILAEMKDMKATNKRRFDGIEVKLKDLEKIPTILRRIGNTEEDLKKVKLDVKSMQDRLDAAKADEQLQNLQGDIDNLKKLVEEVVQAQASSGASALPDVESDLRGRLVALEQRNAELSARRDAFSESEKTSADLVIGGLTVPEGADIKTMATAVLSTVLPEFERRDVISTRFLFSKNTVRSAVAQAVGTTISDDAATSSQQTSNLSSPARSSRPPLIKVTVHSRPLLIEIMKAKTKLGKLHTSAIEAALPNGFDVTKLTPGLLNINEFLPTDVFKLHSIVRRRAKESETKFIYFIRRGKIYLRRKKGDDATLITSANDLDRFLDS